MSTVTVPPAWYAATLAVAMRLHMGQVDKSGAPYWTHLDRTARKLMARWPDATRDQIEAALLHDTLEDVRRAEHHLRAENVRPRVLQIVQALTRPKGADYLDWIRELAAAGDQDVLRVKWADNQDNSDPIRPGFPGRAAMMEAKYTPALAIIEAALEMPAQAVPR